MKKTKQRIVHLVMASILLLALSACSSDAVENDVQADTGSNIERPATESNTELSAGNMDREIGYTAQRLALPEGFADFCFFAFKDNVLYVSGFELNDGIEVTSIYAVRIDTKQAKRIYSEPRNNKLIRSMDIDQDSSLWILEYSSEYTIGFDNAILTDAEETQRIIKLNTASGEVEDTIDLNLNYHLSKILVYAEHLCILASYVYDPEMERANPYALITLDMEGNIVSTIDLPNYPIMSNTSKGIVAGYSTSVGYSIYLFNTEEQQFVDVADIDISDAVMLGSGHNVFFNDFSSLYSYSLDTEEFSVLLNWSSMDILSENFFGVVGLYAGYNGIYMLDDGGILLCELNGIYILSITDGQEVTVRNEHSDGGTLTLATLESDTIRHVVQAFNASNGRYTVEIEDYSVYNTNENSSEGITRLRTEIIAGNVPDIIDLRNIPYDMYDNNGLLADLMPFVERDTDISVSDFEPAVLKALMTNGKLINFVPEFSVLAVFGNSSDIAGSVDSFSDLAAIAGEQSTFGSLLGRSEFVRYALGANNSKFYNFDTGECYFNTDDFVNFLEFAKTQSDDFRNILAHLEPIGNLRFFCVLPTGVPQGLRHYFSGDDIGLVGLPSSYNNGGLIVPIVNYGMASASEHKDGVWEFMKFLVSDEYFKLYGADSFNIRKSKNDNTAQEYRNLINSGQQMERMPDERDIALFREILSSVTGMYRNYEGLYNIVMEDAQAFFDGEITAERAAELIQGRASMYMSERR